MGNRKIMLAVGLFLSVIGHTLVNAEDCSILHFAQCLQDLVSLETGDFHITNEEQMKEVCNAKREAIQCTSHFMKDCSKEGERDLYEATVGGKLKVIEEMCMEGSHINRGYLQNIDCWGKVKDEINFCNDKFNESQRALLKSDMEDRKKVFYGCCAFEWHRNCLAKISKAKCNEQAAQFIYDVSTLLGGNTQQKLCSTSYSSCHGLHGVDQQEIEETLENISSSSKLCLNLPIIQFVTMAFLALVS